MALQTSIPYETPFGTTVDRVYWRWVGLGIDVPAATGTLTLYAYVDAEAFDAKKSPIGRQLITMTGADFAAVAAGIETPGNAGMSATIYAYVRAHVAGFADATDI